MAAPSVDIASQVSPMTSRISSEPLLLASVVVVVTASLAMVALWYVYRLLIKRDEVFKELSLSVGTLSSILGKVAQIQELDHTSTLRNRDLLQEVAVNHSRQDLMMSSLVQEIKAVGVELLTHAKECADRIRKGSI
jgi:Asp-tRNA(Asn)/Glu-tRNA(Gln) amidotransferase C subunit